ncbi:hypothetical protein B0H13DRAFT_2659108 [Mycena leptocephala]|nr:hypothetical protein B0H13DRAFT_2659108 [Mycena leptocephala]
MPAFTIMTEASTSHPTTNATTSPSTTAAALQTATIKTQSVPTPELLVDHRKDPSARSSRSSHIPVVTETPHA